MGVQNLAKSRDFAYPWCNVSPGSLGVFLMNSSLCKNGHSTALFVSIIRDAIEDPCSQKEDLSNIAFRQKNQMTAPSYTY